MHPSKTERRNINISTTAEILLLILRFECILACIWNSVVVVNEPFLSLREPTIKKFKLPKEIYFVIQNGIHRNGPENL